MYFACEIPEGQLSSVQQTLIDNALILSKKLIATGIEVTAVHVAKTKSIYIVGTKFRLRIADHPLYKGTRKGTKFSMDLNRKVMLDKEFDDNCLDYATDIALGIEQGLTERNLWLLNKCVYSC